MSNTTNGILPGAEILHEKFLLKKEKKYKRTDGTMAIFMCDDSAWISRDTK